MGRPRKEVSFILKLQAHNAFVATLVGSSQFFTAFAAT